MHRSVGGPMPFAIGTESADPAGAVECIVSAALDDALREAEALPIARLAAVSLASLAAA